MSQEPSSSLTTSTATNATCCTAEISYGRRCTLLISTQFSKGLEPNTLCYYYYRLSKHYMMASLGSSSSYTARNL